MQGKNKWIDGVLDSTIGMQKAKPAVDLFAKIQGELLKNTRNFIPLSRLRVIMISAAMLVMINVIGIGHHFQSKRVNDQESMKSLVKSEALFLDYSFYSK